MCHANHPLYELRVQFQLYQASTVTTNDYVAVLVGC